MEAGFPSKFEPAPPGYKPRALSLQWPGPELPQIYDIILLTYLYIALHYSFH
jgi:hypothetical protein